MSPENKINIVSVSTLRLNKLAILFSIHFIVANLPVVLISPASRPSSPDGHLSSLGIL
jgi:hypothetical protein